MPTPPIVPTSQPCFPAQNVLWFWFDPATARQMHGTVHDAARKLRTLQDRDMLPDGLEIFLMPSRVGVQADWPEAFSQEFAALTYRTVHIGETEHDFLLRPDAPHHLCQLSAFLQQHDVQRIILHAHHLEHRQEECWKLLEHALPGTEICIENTGFNNSTGHEPEFLTKLCEKFPSCTLCLDIAHVQDFSNYTLSDFTENPIIRERIREIHASFSTYLLREEGRDIYGEKGFPGYDPYHALYSVAGIHPSKDILDLLGNFPVVLEGVVPREDDTLQYLQEEMKIVRSGRETPPHA